MKPLRIIEPSKKISLIIIKKKNGRKLIKAKRIKTKTKIEPFTQLEETEAINSQKNTNKL